MLVIKQTIWDYGRRTLEEEQGTRYVTGKGDSQTLTKSQIRPLRTQRSLVEKRESMDNKWYTMSHTLLSLDIPIINLTIWPASDGQWRCFEMANLLSRKKTSTVHLLSFYFFERNFCKFVKFPKNMSSWRKVPPYCLLSVNISMHVGTNYHIW